MSDRAAGMLIAGCLGLLMPPVAIYMLWRIERDQAEAVLGNIRYEVRMRADNGRERNG